MKLKIIGIFICMLIISSGLASASTNNANSKKVDCINDTDDLCKTPKGGFAIVYGRAYLLNFRFLKVSAKIHAVKGFPNGESIAETETGFFGFYILLVPLEEKTEIFMTACEDPPYYGLEVYGHGFTFDMIPRGLYNWNACFAPVK